MATLSWLIFRGNNHSKKQQYSTDSPHNMQAHGESSVHYRQQASGLHWHEREMYSCLITVALIWHRHVPTNNLMQLSGNRVCNNWLDQNKMQTLTSLQLALCSIHFISTVWPTLHFSHNLVWITAFWSFNKLTISAVHEWSYRSLSEKRLSGIWANKTTKAMHWSKCCGGHVHVT